MQHIFRRLLIFTIFFISTCFALIRETYPTTSSGEINMPVVVGFFVLLFGAISCCGALFIALYKSRQPNQKLPHLMVRDSFIQSSLIATLVAGLLMLQLLKSATLLNIILWVAIVGCLEWFIQARRKLMNKRRYGAENRGVQSTI